MCTLYVVDKQNYRYSRIVYVFADLFINTNQLPNTLFCTVGFLATMKTLNDIENFFEP